MTDKEMFEKLQAKYREAYAAESAWYARLSAQYGEAIHAKRAEREKLKSLRARVQKAACGLLAWLDVNSPRNWRSGVPSHWICSTLSYNDAVTRGPLAVIPPLAYGARPEDIARIARPV